MHSDIVDAALKLVEKPQNVMIGSVGEDGYPYMKMMLAPRVQEGIKKFYFTTNTSSIRVTQFLKNSKASLYFVNQRYFQGLLLKGNMEVLTDQTSKDLIWRTGDEVYYPLGVTDSDYCVLKFTAEDGRYYSNFSNTDFTVD